MNKIIEILNLLLLKGVLTPEIEKELNEYTQIVFNGDSLYVFTKSHTIEFIDKDNVSVLELRQDFEVLNSLIKIQNEINENFPNWTER